MKKAENAPLLVEEEKEHIEIINDSKYEYHEHIDETKQIYWICKDMVKQLRAKGYCTSDCRRYANRHASRILQKVKART